LVREKTHGRGKIVEGVELKTAALGLGYWKSEGGWRTSDFYAFRVFLRV
jgi:hypothetical protein